MNRKVVETNSTSSEAYSLSSNACDPIEDYCEAQTGQNQGPKNPKSPDNTSYSSHKNIVDRNIEHPSSDEVERTRLKGSTKPQREKDRSPKNWEKRDKSPQFTDQDQYQEQHQNSPSQQILNPQRHWGNEQMAITHPINNNINGNFLNDRDQQRNYQYINQTRDGYKPSVNQNIIKPNHIAESTKSISTVGPDGSTIKVTTTSTRHDGEEVHTSTTQDIRLQRLAQLEAIGAAEKLSGSKRPDSLRLFITKLDPETTPGDMERSLLSKFPQLERLHAKRHRMEKNNHYCSYSVIVYGKKGLKLNIDDFVEYDWEDDIRCFPALDRFDRNI